MAKSRSWHLPTQHVLCLLVLSIGRALGSTCACLCPCRYFISIHVAMPHLPFSYAASSLPANGISFISDRAGTLLMTHLHDPWSSGAFAADGHLRPSALSARRGQRCIKCVIIVWKDSDENKHFSVTEGC